MIYYTSAEANFWRVFIVWYGSVIPRAIPQAMFSAGLAVLYEMLGLSGERQSLIQHTYVLHVLGMVLGFILVQRSNLAYQRWWEARTSIAQMSGKWSDTITQLVEFEHISPLEDARHFRARMIHLGSLLFAMAMCDLREDWKYTEGVDTVSLKSAYGLELRQPIKRRRTADEDSQAIPQAGAPARANSASVKPSSDPGSATQRTSADVTDAEGIRRATLQRYEQHQKLDQVALHKRQAQSGLSPWRFISTSMLYINDPVAYGQQALANCFSVIGGLSAGERRSLSASHSRDRVQMVQSWIVGIMVERHHRGGLPVPAPILSRTYQVLSDGHLGYMQARKVGDTPFPFPYVQLVTLLLHVFNVICPLVISAFVGTRDSPEGLESLDGIGLIVVITFFVTLGYTALNQVSRELEDPYGHGPNHLPLVQFQEEFNSKLVHLFLRDSGAVIPDDPFLGADAETLSEEEKTLRRKAFGGDVAADGARLEESLSKTAVTLVGLQDALDYTVKAHDATMTSRAQLVTGSEQESSGNIPAVSSMGGLQTGVPGLPGARSRLRPGRQTTEDVGADESNPPPSPNRRAFSPPNRQTGVHRQFSAPSHPRGMTAATQIGPTP